MSRLENHTAIVTGSSSGIGRAMAQRFASEGAYVLLADRVEETRGGGETTLDLIKQSGGAADFLKTNVASWNDLSVCVEHVVAQQGRLDIMVNNAGITRDGLAMRMKDEEWNEVLNVNLTSSFKLARACLRGMMKRRHGRIVSITSVVGTMGNPGQANYAASKAGTVGMSKALAQEVASRGITVNCVAPGFIETAMTDALNEKQREAILTTIPAGRLGQGDEVASAVLYLASDEADYITGQTLHVNGGMAMI